MSLVTVSNRLWEPVRIGSQIAYGRSDLHKVAAYLQTADGYVQTPDVDAAAWNAWHAAHIDSPAVKNGSIFAAQQFPANPADLKPKPAKRRGS
jgi:hypothetical protein